MSTILFLLNMSFLLCLLGLSFHRTHFMLILLCIEGMMLILYLTMTMFAYSTNTPTITMLPILLLALSACEASTGLALMVATTRTHGTDHMTTLSLLKC
uniref:NADH-ubiquinone oxidoreductase chain 4L n=1 Tax=Algyroides nigropunctatus TaxID=64414 RepID=A0A8A3WT08_9SAUR|nr:NADH dehydrogenase subunit 4L [Algyroides nigropunctatus]QTA72676.1 NADH dehydrogenase subunit 4L [Algyroides nigropunctatus]